jgi:hypothetical protein
MLPGLRQRICSLFFALLFSTQSAYAARFLDTSGNWAETYVNILSDKGIIPAASDGNFKPNEPVTRAVLASWMVKVLNLQDQPVPQTPSFADVKASDWFYRDVEIIRQNNFISGYADGFRPNQFIQKGEVISIVARALNKPAPDETQIEDELAKYKDASKVPSWARTGIAEASLAGILLTGPDSLSIGADKLATRADTIALLYKLDEFLARRDESDALRRTARQNQPPPNTAYNQGWNGSAPQNQMVQPGGQNYQGQVAKGDYFGAQSPYSGPPPQYGAAGNPQYGAAPNPQYGQAQGGPGSPGNALQGGVIVLAAGTKFKAQLKNSIDSAATQTGEEIRAIINEPIYANGTEVIPAGSRLVGSCSSVTPAKRFKAGANGKMEIKFTSCETPDGRTIPLSASIDESEQRMSGGTTAGRIGKGLVTTGVGAAGGAALGTALGAIVGGTTHGNVGASTGMGAVFGTALGAGVGGVGAIVRKGSELKITAGTALPIKLDEQMPIQLPQPGAIRAQYPPQPPRNY